MKAKPVVNTNPSGIPKAELLKLIAAYNERPGISLALFIASGALLNKRTWEGGDYATHWLKVADIDSDDMTDEEKIIGILHDVVEDSDFEIEDLEAVGFSPRICEGVRRVTKAPGEKYFDAVQRCGHDDASRKIKRRDNKHNMDLTRSPFPATPKQKYLYQISYMYLGAIDKKQVPVGFSVWKFLQMPEYNKLLTKENWSYVVAATSEAPPEALVTQFAPAKRPGGRRALTA